MKRRSIGLGLAVVMAGALAVGCSGGGGGLPGGGDELESGRGTLSLPLLTQGVSGTSYRLRNATFEISNPYFYYDYPYQSGSGGEGGAAPQNVTVSSEDDPDAASIQVSVERGSYYVRLLPGWHLEKVDNEGATEVEATLLSPSEQWVYVYAHSTSWVEFEFGLGERKLWFNGQLNIELRVRENPSEIYGTAGQSGYGGDGNSYGGYGG